MAVATIFCPRCDTLILEADRCPTCHWHRPVVTSEVGKPIWAVALEVKLPRQESHPLAVDGMVYAPTENSQLVALDALAAVAEDSIKWRHQFDQRYRCHTVTVWNEDVLVGLEYTGGFPAPPGELLFLSAENGDEVGRFPVDGASISVPVVRDNVAYFTVNTGWLYALDLATRQEVWRKKIEGTWSWAPAAPLLTPANLFILPSRSGQLAAFDPARGEIVWTFVADGWFPQTPVWLEEMVYARCWDRHLYALEAGIGQEIWRHRAPRDYSSDFWLDESYLYVGVKDYQAGAENGSRAYSLYLLDRHTGERVSRYEVQGHIFARPVAAEKAVFFTTDDRSREVNSQGTLYGLDLRHPQNPEPLWEPYIVEQRFQSDLLLVDDRLIAGTHQGAMYAFRWQAAQAITEAPAVYAQQGDWERAAIAYAQQGDYVQAAEIYAQQLNRPRRAGQLYLRAGEYDRVIELLGPSAVETERGLAIEAAQALAEPAARAKILRDLGDFLDAARAYKEAGDWVAAGECYQEAQEWEEARAAYAYARAWERWDKLTRDLELWQDLVARFLEAGEYAQAADVYANELGLFLEAATCYDKAGQPAKALAAYSQVAPERLTPEAQRRLAELAEQEGKLEVALEAYRAVDDRRKVAEMLEKSARHLEAADIFTQEGLWGRAAANLEQQVEREIERLGGVRYVRRNKQVEEWLQRAITLFEDEDEVAETEDDRNYFYRCIRRCRNKLAQLRREPLLKVDVQTDFLTLNQSSAVQCVVENIGWGTARDLTLTVGSSHLQHPVAPLELGDLRRNETATTAFTVVPNIAGAIMLQVNFQGQTKHGEVRTFPVEGGSNIILEARADLAPQPPSVPRDDLGRLWDESTPSDSSEDIDGAPVSQEELVRQRIESLRRQLAQHYRNLNKYEEQAAKWAGEAPVHLQNQIEDEQQAITDIEEQLGELEK
ncbi:MAG: PQQ-binding-like beta-propeller repeat protein [Anaerolineae bacterium]|nr:PQQ-binding-like beta-propeller repeat protein [Anaerolineae bacterium]